MTTAEILDPRLMDRGFAGDEGAIYPDDHQEPASDIESAPDAFGRFLEGIFSQDELADLRPDQKLYIINGLGEVFLDQPNIARSTPEKRQERISRLQDSLIVGNDETVADRYGISPASLPVERGRFKRWFRSKVSFENRQELLASARTQEYTPVISSIGNEIDLTATADSGDIYTRETKARSSGRVEPLILVDQDPDDDQTIPWQETALCAQTDPEAFFPEKGGSTREAKRVCGRCDVRDDCLTYALDNDERFGIWGGLSERERRRLKRRVI